MNYREHDHLKTPFILIQDMSDKNNPEVESFKEKIKKEAEELVLKKFPQKILDLNVLMNSEKFSPNSRVKPFEINISIPNPKSNQNPQKPSNDSKVGNQTKIKELVVDEDDLIIVKPLLFPDGRVESHKQFIEMVDELKPRMIELTEDIILLKLAVSLMVPKIEDGNNFGVEIQTETITALSHIEIEVLKCFDKFGDYFEERGDLLIKVAKYPHNRDFRISVEELDQRFHLYLCLTMSDIYNHYVSCHDLVTKNLNKIKNPRTQDNRDFLY